jgi:transcriptional regulator with XRE-family HTH domain
MSPTKGVRIAALGEVMESELRRENSRPRVRRKIGSVGRREKADRVDQANGRTAAFDLSSRLHQLRIEHGYSLAQLADKASLTKGFLSLVERGKKAPSISSLLRLSHVYGLSIGALLDEASPRESPYSLVRSNERMRFAREGSLYGYRYEALAFRKKRKTMEPFIVSPPLRLPRRHFQHEGDEMVFVFSGQVEIHLGAERIRLLPGDCLYFDARTPHRSRSMGRERAQTLVVVDARE